MDKLSVITVSFNAKATIEETINSVLELEWREKEYIVIDGQSDDGTTDIIKKYEEKIDYWCSEKDEGIYDAMNKGIQRATGEWVAFLNCGDTYYKDACNWIGNINSDIDLVYGNNTLTKWNGEIKERKAAPLTSILYHMVSCHQAFFIRRKLFNELGGYDVSYKIAADYAWVLEAYLRGKSFHFEDILIVNYRAGGVSDLEYELLYREYYRICVEKVRNNKSITSNDYSNVLDAKRKQCLYFYIKEELEKEKNDNIYNLIITNEKYNKYRNIAIWCMGNYGRRMANYLNICGIKVKYYVDENSKAIGNDFYKISSPECMNLFCGLIILTTSNEKFQYEIKQFIEKKLNGDISVITLDELGEKAYEENINAEMKKLERVNEI